MAYADELRKALKGLPSIEQRALVEWRLRWLDFARPKQIIDFKGIEQDTIFYHPGRGWGKNVTGVNWICWDLAREPMFGHLIAPTHNDLRWVCFEGESGIMRWVPPILIRSYNSSDMVLEFYNGSVLRGFSAEKPERLRGPQCHRLWSDEIASWLRMRETYEQALFGLRLGTRAQHLITSTPLPKEMIRELMLDPNVLKIGGHQRENEGNLSPAYIKKMRRLEGTRLGRQELAGELLDAEELGVVKRSQWRHFPHIRKLPDFELIVLSLDTAFSEDEVDVKKQKTDYTACTVWGAYREHPKLESGAPNLDAKPLPNILLLDAWQERLGFPDLVARVKREKEARYGSEHYVTLPQYGPVKYATGTGRKADLLLIEDKASGISLRQTLQRDGIPVTPYNPGKADKYTRLNLIADLFVSGYVWAVTSAARPGEFKDWAEPVIGQMCSYSGEGSLEHDDLLDSATGALLWLKRNWLGIEAPVTRRQAVRNSPAGANPYAS